MPRFSGRGRGHWGGRWGGRRWWGWPGYNRFYYPIYNYSYPYDIYGLDRTVVVQQPVKETTVVEQHISPWIWAAIGGSFLFFVVIVALISIYQRSLS